jgi:hypothetical protein
MMKKFVYLAFGFLMGFFSAEILRRKKMERLAEFEAKEAHSKAQYAEYEREWQEELANMPFEERMDWELFEAALRQSNYQPDWDEEDDDEDDDYEEYDYNDYDDDDEM